MRSNPLRRPFPDREFGRAQVMGLLRIAVFIFVFLYIFRPFADGHVSNYLPICFGYGAVTFTVSVAYHYTTERWLGWQRSGDHWTLGRWIMDCAALLAFISLGNFVFYNAMVGWCAFDPNVFLAIAGPTILVGLFPIAFSGMTIQLKAERENQLEATRLYLRQDSGRPFRHEIGIVLTDDFSVAPAALLYCEALKNYVRVVHHTDTGPEETTIRATLTGVEERLRDTPVIRCHRSFLVNVDRVSGATGNAQGLRLTFPGHPEEVPVSRSFVPALREVLDDRP